MFEQCVIFTDLDGTLLDHHNYTWSPARPALDQAKQYDIPIIINTSKTRAEVVTLINDLKFEQQPYVVENGSAIIFPYLPPNLLLKLQSKDQYQFINNQHTWVLGEYRKPLCKWLKAIREKYKFNFESYQDWSTKKLMEITGLSESKAKESQLKEFSEPFVWLDSDENLARFIQLAESKGYSILKGGRFYHLQGSINKGSALTFIREYQEYLFPKATSLKLIALGDNQNDVAMLDESDLAVCIKSPVNDFPMIKNSTVIYSKEYGPVGWNEEVLALIELLEIYYPNPESKL